MEGAPKGAVINYYSSNDKVADVDITSGAITLKRRGTTDITVVYRGDNKNNYALVTYTLRVDDANDPNGTSAHPFTVSEAIQYAKDGKGSVGYNYFVKGIVCKVDSANNGAAGGISIPGLTNNSVEGTLTYWLSDNGVMKDSLKVSNTRVADVTEDGWLRTLATGHDTVTVSVPVTVTGGGTYTMSRNFRLRVITTNTRLGHFELVNDASTLQVGDSLMIVATKDDKSYAISANDQSAPIKGVYISNGKKMIK